MKRLLEHLAMLRRSIIERARIIAKDQATKTYRTMGIRERTTRDRVFMWGMGILALATLISCVYDRFASTNPWPLIAAGPALILLFVAFLLRTWLETHDYMRPGRCRRCGYNLSHLTTTTCPECGRQFDPPASSAR